jgi:hypothetical protein
MSDETMTKYEVLSLVDERIKIHDEATNEPKHVENKALIREATIKLDALILSVTKIETTANLVMRFAMGGLVVWVVKQFVELAKSFQH